MQRRTFIKHTGVLTSMMGLAPSFSFGAKADRKFKVSLNPGAIGVQCTQKELIDYANRHRFEAISPLSDQLTAMSSNELDEILAQMHASKLTWDAVSLPIDFRKDQQTFREGLSSLPKVAKTCQSAGVTRMNTWIMPSHNELTYNQNFNQHRDRLRQIAEIAQDHGIRFGLEYVGTKRLKTIHRYPFAGTMKEMLELIAAINVAGVGLQLDAYHWYTSTETVADLLALKNEQIVTCDLNDASSGRTIEEQVDGERELPGDSGLIDLKGFMQALVKIGYDGAVRAEPFNAKLNAMENEEAIAKTSSAMWRTVGLIDAV
ncbi:sugar phosphate isomerase/epimerase family protein [Lunatimonas salinarum]|uniref:sugar phosphate isomerase/epimerase family protein n=1 Tax=Lunatimonas salinarum TaxID=1774590 RepID=UPI001FD78E6A|nr:sugar phosphate isomerase/epimerase family protein [Lunatimonas salinarum]